MEGLALKLLQMSLHGAVLILIAALLRKLLLRALPKGILRLLWLPVLLALAVPLPDLFVVSLPVPPSLESAPLSEMKEREPLPETAAVDVGETRGPVSVSEDAGENRDPGVRPVRPLSLFGVVWLMGACIFGTVLLCLYLAELRRFRRAIPIEGDQVKEWLRQHRAARSIELRVLPDLRGPMTYGIFHPVILLPQEPDWTDPGTLLTLEHEFAHAQHMDAAWKLLANLLLSLHWFNPAVWLMTVLLGRDLELSCDESVLLRLGSDQRMPFANVLLDTCRLNALKPYPGLGAGAMRERVYSIMTFRRKSVLRQIIATALVLGLTVCAFGTLRTGAADERRYRNGNLTLAVPAEVAELLTIEMPPLSGESEEVLFRIYERESREAGLLLYPESRRDYGLLLTIYRMDETDAGKSLLRTASGREVLARDFQGDYYVMRRAMAESNMLSAPGEKDQEARWERRKLVNHWVRDLRQYTIWNTPIQNRYPAHSAVAASWFAGVLYRPGKAYRIGMGEESPYSVLGFSEAESFADRLIWETVTETCRSYALPEGEPIILTRPSHDRALWFWEGSDMMLCCSDIGDTGFIRHVYTVRLMDAPDQKAGDLIKAWYDSAKAAGGA